MDCRIVAIFYLICFGYSQITVDVNKNIYIQPIGSGSVSVPHSDLQINGVSMNNVINNYPTTFRSAEHMQILNLDKRRVQMIVANATANYDAAGFISVGSDTYLAAGASGSLGSRIYKWDGINSFEYALSVTNNACYGIKKVETFTINGTAYIFFAANLANGFRSILYKYDQNNETFYDYQDFVHGGTIPPLLVGAQFITTLTKQYLVLTPGGNNTDSKAYLWNGTYFNTASPLNLTTGATASYSSRCFNSGGVYCLVSTVSGVFSFAYNENTNTFVYNRTFGGNVTGLDVITFNSITFISAASNVNSNIYKFDNTTAAITLFQANLPVTSGAGTTFFSFDNKLYLLFADVSTSAPGQPLYRYNNKLSEFEFISYVNVTAGKIWSYGTINKTGYLYLAATKPTYLFELICENAGCV